MSIEKDARRLAAIVAADMVGYSRLMEIDEAGTITRQKAINDDLINPKVREFGGRVVKTTGDGALIEFPSAVNAVLCAVAVQREMASREVDIPEDRRISYRVGINLGEIIYDDDDIFGDGVNVASRLEGLAEPGGIRISEAVFNNVKGKLDLGFADLGLQKVKNLSEPISTFKVLLDPGDIGKIIKSNTTRSGLVRNVLAVFAVIVLIAGGGYFAFDRLAPRGSEELKLLILPVTAENADSSLIADAATENLIASFARLKGLTTAPHRISMEYKGIDVSPDDLPEGLGIRYILDGSVKQQDDRVTLSARLRDTLANGDGVVWEEAANGEPTQLFDLLATLKQNATNAMKIKLNATERAVLNAQQTDSAEAYLAFADAQRIFYEQDFSRLKTALSLYRKAMDLDPRFVGAQESYAELNFLIWRRSYNTVKFSPNSFSDAKSTIEAILATDSLNPHAIGLGIQIEIELLNIEQAVLEARAAIFLQPEIPWLKYVLGRALLSSGEYEAAEEEFSSYERLSPALNSGEKRDLADQYLRLGEVAKVLSLLESVPSEESNELAQFRLLAEAHARNGDIEIAKTYEAKLLKAVSWLSVVWFESLFDIYSDPNIYKDWSDAVIAAGLPETPYDFAKKTEHDKLLHADLVELFSARHVEIHDKDAFGAPYKEDRRVDGTIIMNFEWLPDAVVGKWHINNGQFCTIFPSQQMGRETCNNVYIDTERSTDGVKYISNLYNFGVIHSTFRRVAN